MSSRNQPFSGADLRSFGRRRGRSLSQRQQRLLHSLLPSLALNLDRPAPADVCVLFHKVTEVWIEIGFGAGEHLIWQAEHHPHVGIIGCEPFQDGIVKVLSAIEQRVLENIRLYTDDARAVLRWLPKASIARAFILFPDPWPKKRQQKRRLISSAIFRLLAHVMRPGAQLKIATDVDGYARAILLAARLEADFAWTAQRPQDWRARPKDWPVTRYELKALGQRRRCYYLTFERIQSRCVANSRLAL
jgi:tRNA (guanine-N7-)-methyltransferase